MYPFICPSVSPNTFIRQMAYIFGSVFSIHSRFSFSLILLIDPKSNFIYSSTVAFSIISSNYSFINFHQYSLRHFSIIDLLIPTASFLPFISQFFHCQSFSGQSYNCFWSKYIHLFILLSVKIFYSSDR